ncbi:prolyl oligopeptidase family serine peptidase [Microbacterium sp. No. 7]|uniref:prolyl oligopeptidase family serine peptidase n=1 Tax=Microbacterium sp. No. 7 TaxID=1714373 RepID=UPI0006CFCA99|nr:prolyl oligopeptidase family serine peptidase [Microbacterium sp. No. 7]ALJ21022.1 peptidase S9 [Microbacterium sp. No. 7]
MVATLPYGSWPSPLTAEWASAASPRLEGAAFVGAEVWWGQSIPAEGGRTAVLRRTAEGTDEVVLPAPWNARSSVHEYGGGSWAASPDGRLFFVERSDQRVWMLAPGGEPVALTPPDERDRHGGLVYQAGTLLAVRERHGDAPVPERAIVAISEAGGVTVLASGSDFVAQPALSPRGDRLAWVAWDHPDMPWDRTELRVGRIVDGAVDAWEAVSSGTTSALQPTWVADDELLFCDDPTGRWNLWRRRDGSAAEPVAPADADTGGPLWVLGARWFAALGDGGVVAARTHGSDEVVRIAPDGAVTPVAVPVSARVLVEATDGARVLVSGAGPAGGGIWLVDADGSSAQIVGAASGTDAGWMPIGRAVTYAGPHGDVHAFDFAPTSPEAAGPEGELPPYVVFVHGGPTAHVGGVADSKTAFFTSRGIGVLDVNYGGSTGYGRAYRERLRGQWGVVDVDDVAAAVRGLVAEGRADAARIAIEGGSAGGWTVLAALAGTDVFGAGISRYGVGDARALAADTHDFEARYLDGLIGPLPEAEPVYVERSPLSRPERFRAPLLLLQGDEDAVVPPSQAEAIRDALAARGVPHAYVLYAGEGHGFRRAETIVHALESELAFLGQVFGFETPGVPPIALS